MRRPFGHFLGIFSLAFVACSSTAETTGGGVVPTEITVEPQYFLGTTPCSALPGAMHAFVAAITDVTAGAMPFQLPASAPLSCSDRAEFQLVVDGHGYTATVAGYDVPVDLLEPVAGISSGDTRIKRTDTNQIVSPRWTTTCAAKKPVIALAGKQVAATPCEPLMGTGGTGTTVLLDPNTTLGALACADKGGQVATFDVLRGGATIATGVPCGAMAACPGPTCIQSGLAANTEIDFRVEARDQKGTVGWAASCFAVPREGLVVPATCDALTDQGAIQVDIASVLALHTPPLVCGKDVATYEATVEATASSPAITTGVLPCSQNLTLEPVSAETHTLAIATKDASGQPALDALCTATVAPASSAQAVCTLAP